MGKSRTPKGPASTDASAIDQDGAPSVGRRALIRRAATVAAAGIGGIAATEMLTAGPAAAAAGDPMVLGPNNATTAQTTLTSAAAAGASFQVSHTAHIANMRLAPVDDSVTYGDKVTGIGDQAGVMLGGELINLTETVPDPNGGTQDVDTLFWMAGGNPAHDLTNLAVVLTTATGTVFVPYGPFRALDTRTVSGRTLLASTTVLDSSHRLIGGQTLELDLSGFVDQFAYAVHFNLTVASSTGGGYLTAFGSQTGPDGPPARPLASNINFTKGAVIANHSVSPLTDRLSLFVFASATTHVILDIQGWTLPDFSFLVNNGGAAQLGQQGLRSKQAKGLGVVRRPVQRNRKG